VNLPVAFIERTALNFDFCKFVRAVWFVFFSSGFADILVFYVKFGKFDCVTVLCKFCINA